MRTSLMLNDELVAEAKRQAADRQVSLSTIVNEALRRALHPPTSAEKPTRLRIPTYRPADAGIRDTTPDQLDELMAAEDRAPYHP